jgi:hypothetical protein
MLSGNNKTPRIIVLFLLVATAIGATYAIYSNHPWIALVMFLVMAALTSAKKPNSRSAQDGVGGDSQQQIKQGERPSDRFRFIGFGVFAVGIAWGISSIYVFDTTTWLGLAETLGLSLLLLAIGFVGIVYSQIVQAITSVRSIGKRK